MSRVIPKPSKLTGKTVASRIKKAQTEIYAIEARMKTLKKEIEVLKSRCPHTNWESAQYMRWCRDCGECWDTT